MTRLLIYGTFSLLAGLMLVDTNIGMPISSSNRPKIAESASLLSGRGFRAEADFAFRIAQSRCFRRSVFYAWLARTAGDNGADFGFYAYTPILSRTRVFLSDEFWNAGVVGRSSLLIHEISHIRWHGRRLMRGFPRRLDEAQAYKRQYLTHRELGLSPTSDGMVYWNMMVGVKDYLIPVCPEYALRDDVRDALRQLGGEE